VRYVVTALLALAVVFAASPAPAQEWSSSQKEIWQNVETYWGLFAQKDLKDHTTYFGDVPAAVEIGAGGVHLTRPRGRGLRRHLR
jgi:hypothetical protein